ncbi:MAG: GNAT family N-acetyltransferase [Oscillibacter sp.]|jgi:GNAT superfamily N-acetyltransferase|nr:GNAT family N-acetyltransferase [Oscillibacter sp.]
MKLILPTTEQLKKAYCHDLTASFPPAELKPLEAIERHLAAGRYRPWCLFEGEELMGEAFLWAVKPGWALLDYLCVTPEQRNAGLGATLIEAMCAAEPHTTIFAETEAPTWAPNPALASRRQGFYRRNGARFAGFQSCVFGVVYDLIYWSDEAVPDEILMREYDAVYRGSFPADKYEKYVQIPYLPGNKPMPEMPWDEA